MLPSYAADPGCVATRRRINTSGNISVSGRWRIVPMLWWPSDEVVSAVLDGEGPWPSRFPVSNGMFVPFDVDKYDGLAVVVGYGRNRKGREVLGSDEFQQNESGEWQHLAGGGSGWA